MQGNGIQRLFEHNRSASKPTNESAEPVADNSTPDDEALGSVDIRPEAP